MAEYASSGSGREVCLRTSKRRLLRRLTVERDVRAVAMRARTGARVAVAAGSGRELFVVDAADGRVRARIARAGWGKYLVFSRCGRFLFAGCGSAIGMYDADTGALQREFVGLLCEVFELSLSSSGELLAFDCADNAARVRRTTTGEQALLLLGHTHRVVSVAFAPNDALLATGSHDKTVKLFSTDGGALLRTLDGHTNAVECVCFAPDGATLASGGSDKTIRVWDVAAGTCVRALANHASAVSAVLFSNDGALC